MNIQDIQERARLGADNMRILLSTLEFLVDKMEKKIDSPADAETIQVVNLYMKKVAELFTLALTGYLLAFPKEKWGKKADECLEAIKKDLMNGLEEFK